MNIRFEPGDKVRLQSGGPAMTIRGWHYDVLNNEYKNDVVDCIWYTQTQAGKRHVCYHPYQVKELIKLPEQ